MSYVLVSLLSLIAGAILRARAERRSPTRRLGLLGSGDAIGAVRRADRLVELGDGGTQRTYNCGRILHVDYERGEIVTERDPSRG